MCGDNVSQGHELVILKRYLKGMSQFLLVDTLKVSVVIG